MRVRTPPHAHPTEWVAAEVAAFLAARDRSRPLFLVVSFPIRTRPTTRPEPYASMYDPADSILPEEGFEVNAAAPMVFADGHPRDQTQGAERPYVVRKSSLRRSAASSGRSTTRSVAAWSGSTSTTIIFFTSDHGDYAGHRGPMRKKPWVPFDDLARVPVRGGGPGRPQRATGSRSLVAEPLGLALTLL